MPYIKKEDRPPLDYHADQLGYLAKTPGELNYSITKVIHRYLFLKDVNYANLNEVIGVLECAKQELYSIVCRNYENKKLKENGIVGILDIEKEV